MRKRNQMIIGGAIALLIMVGGALVLATRGSSQIEPPGVIFGLLFLIGALMLVAGRLRLVGGLAITGWRARLMGFFWVLPLLTSYVLQAGNNATLRDLRPQVMTVTVFLALVAGVIVLALTLAVAEKESPEADSWWRN